MDKYPPTALVCLWTDKVFEKEHLIELTDEMFTIGEGTYCPGIRVGVGDPGMYNVSRLRPLTRAAKAFLTVPT